MIPFLFLLFSFFFLDCGSQRMKLAQAVIDARLADAEHVAELHDARAGLFKARLRRLAQAVQPQLIGELAEGDVSALGKGGHQIDLAMHRAPGADDGAALVIP